MPPREVAPEQFERFVALQDQASALAPLIVAAQTLAAKLALRREQARLRALARAAIAID